VVRVSASVAGKNVHEPVFVTPGPTLLYDDVFILRPVLTRTRLGTSAKQQHREDECRLREHKSKALKAATIMYSEEKTKEKGMSLRKVTDYINRRYQTTLDHETLRRYYIQGLINTSPKKRGPVGNYDPLIYKSICSAVSSYIRINQINATFHSRRKLAQMVAKGLRLPCHIHRSVLNC
jgi:hypothetical protein